MSVIAILTKEHRLFMRLASRLRPSPNLTDDGARSQISDTLLVLLPALGRHDEVEEVFFDGQVDPSKDAVLIRQLTRAQHAELHALRGEIGAVLAAAQGSSFPRLKSLAGLLCEKLAWHLQTEEMLVWPLHAHESGRSVGRSIELQAGRNLRALENAIEKLNAAARQRVRGA